jgi:acetyl-CoA carboxylase carboxyl transferase subunit beta
MKHIFSQKGNGKNYRRNHRMVSEIQCSSCGRNVLEELAVTNLSICPFCGADFRMKAKDRIKQVFDEDTFSEINSNLKSKDILNFPDYKKKLIKYEKSTGLKEAVVTGIGEIDGIKTAAAIMDASFMMGSMGAVVGTKIVEIAEYATKNKLPLLIFCASGGARMQEGMFSLIQMSRCSIAINRHSEAGLLYVSILTHPTTGGVAASFAMQGDIILAEPAALIGFAGPRVIQQTVKEVLPDGFQRSEYLLENGMIDAIVKRKEMKETLSKIIKMHMPQNMEGGKK